MKYLVVKNCFMKVSYQEWIKKLNIGMYSEYNIYKLICYFSITYISTFITVLW